MYQLSVTLVQYLRDELAAIQAERTRLEAETAELTKRKDALQSRLSDVVHATERIRSLLLLQTKLGPAEPAGGD